MSFTAGKADSTHAPEGAAVASRYLVAVMAVFASVAIVVHAVTLHYSSSTNSMNSIGEALVGTRTLVFAGAGLAFMAFTLLSHLVIASALSAGSQAVRSPRADMGPLGGLLISMAIRVAGTFAILALLWNSELISRKEVVFDVLFWYVTLTAMEVVGIVWASRSFMRGSSFEQVAQTSDS